MRRYTTSNQTGPCLTASRSSSTDTTTWCQRSSIRCGTRGEIAVHTTPLWDAVKQGLGNHPHIRRMPQVCTGTH